MIKDLGINRGLWLANGLLALVASVVGVVSFDIYKGVAGSEVLPGIVSQDVLTVVAAVLLLFLGVRSQKGAAKEQVVILGLLGYLFYAYGIYAIEQVYNSLYFIYLALFGLSFYSMIYGVASIRPEVARRVALPDRMRKVAAGFSFFIAILFSLLWIITLVPLLQRGDRVEHFFSIYILDLSFIMPAFAILAVMVLRKAGLGLLLTPAMYVLGATLLFPVGLGELLKPAFDVAVEPGGVVLYFGVSALFLAMAVVYLRKLTFAERAPAGKGRPAASAELTRRKAV